MSYHLEWRKWTMQTISSVYIITVRSYMTESRVLKEHIYIFFERQTRLEFSKKKKTSLWINGHRPSERVEKEFQA